MISRILIIITSSHISIPRVLLSSRRKPIYANRNGLPLSGSRGAPYRAPPQRLSSQSASTYSRSVAPRPSSPSSILIHPWSTCNPLRPRELAAAAAAHVACHRRGREAARTVGCPPRPPRHVACACAPWPPHGVTRGHRTREEMMLRSLLLYHTQCCCARRRRHRHAIMTQSRRHRPAISAPQAAAVLAVVVLRRRALVALRRSRWTPPRAAERRGYARGCARRSSGPTRRWSCHVASPCAARSVVKLGVGVALVMRA